MASRDELKQISSQLAEILHELLAVGNWEASLFLRTAQKKLQAIEKEAAALSEELNKNVQPDKERLHRDKIKQGFITVYVSIYQSDPHQMVKWENTLKSIKEYSITRPIYRVEQHVQEAIRSKPGSLNEGYASVYIREVDIITPYAGKKIEDRWGHELLTLRDGCLLPTNIVEFVHEGRRYEFRNGKLVLKSDISR